MYVGYNYYQVFYGVLQSILISVTIPVNTIHGDRL